MTPVYWPLLQTYRFFLLTVAFLFALLFISIFIVPDAHPAQVSLAWDPNTEADLAGYKIYYGNYSENYQWTVDVGNQTTCTISNLLSGKKYYIAATAYDSFGNESDYSNEVLYSATTCTYTLAPARQSFTALGGPGAANLTAAAGCNWTAVSNAPWITITSNSSGSGNAATNYSVQPNTEITSRTGTLTIGGKNLTVTQAGAPKYTLTIRKVGAFYGTVTNNPPGTTFKVGTVVNLTATPNTNATFSGWSGAYTGTSPNCSVTMNKNNTVTATFAVKKYTITATAGAGGTITPKGSVIANYGTTKRFTIRPNTNYEISDVKVDGASRGKITTYTFTNVTTNHTIQASFIAGPTPK